jgi:peroxin-4
MAPPQAVFITKLFHPNVHFKTGAICLDILKRESWVPAWGIASVCRALQALLSSPEADSPLNCDAGNMIRANDLRAYRSMAKMYAELYANKLDIKTRLSGNSPNTSN